MADPDKKGQSRGFNDGAANSNPPPRVPGEYKVAKEWDFWFALKECARLRQWQKLHDTLEDNRHLKISNQHFTEEVFHTACNLGRTDVIAALLARGFLVDTDSADKLFERIARFYPENAPAVIGYFAGAGYDVKSAIYQVAVHGKPETMAGLKARGCDILAEGNSFFLAFDAGNAAMMQYLAAQGANLFAPAVTGTLCDGEEHGGAKETFRRIVAFDGAQLANYYAYVAPNKPDLSDFRDIPFGVSDHKTTLMHLAARTGHFHEVIAAAPKEKREPLTAGDLLRQDADGVSVLAILLARGEVRSAFDPRLWQHAPGEIAKLASGLKALRAAHVIDAPAAIAEAGQHRLRQRAEAGRWSLKKRPKAP